MSDNFKETTFVKIVERTAKRDAYETAVIYVKQFGLEHGLKILQDKADGHSKFLDEQPLAYDYATQTLSSKAEVPDGRAVSAAMSTLVGAIKP